MKVEVRLESESIYWSTYDVCWKTHGGQRVFHSRRLLDAELEEVIHHALGNLSGEQIKADGGSSAPAIVRAIREAERRIQ